MKLDGLVRRGPQRTADTALAHRRFVLWAPGGAIWRGKQKLIILMMGQLKRTRRVQNDYAATNRNSSLFQEIADLRNISKRTVDVHIADAMQKLNARNRTHAVAITLRKGIIT